MPDNTCMLCGRIIPEGRHICLSCEGQNEMQRFVTDMPKPKTNGDRIRAMNNWDLAKYLHDFQCNTLMMGAAANVDGIFDYLENEIQNEEQRRRRR